MQEDFHYYATYCAAYLAGYTHEECLEICYSANFVDLCTRALLLSVGAPVSAATTQFAMEMADVNPDLIGLQDVTRIWASFHFLPRDLHAEIRKGSRMYRNKYRLICGPNGDLVLDTVGLAKGRSLQAAGIAMHVLADTWAHMYFAGTPSLVINNTDSWFYEEIPEGESYVSRKIRFRHSLGKPDDLETGVYTNSLFQSGESAIMNLGHGRAGHLPDYSFMRYRYLPAWGDYEEIVKDNPSDYLLAFRQMVEALKYLRGSVPSFEKEQYDSEATAPYEEEIRRILAVRRLSASEDWKALGKRLSGETIPEFDKNRYLGEYRGADPSAKDETFLGRFVLGALAQKSMVTERIFRSGNLLAGFSVDYRKKGLRGIRDFYRLVTSERKKERDA